MTKKRAVAIVDRYSALCLAVPRNPCKGHCEGTGWIPVKRDDRSRVLAALWLAAEKKKPAADGWHFVKCPKCNGTGKKAVKK